MGIVLFYILCCIGTFVLAVFYAFMMRKHYKNSNKGFSFFSLYAWLIFLSCWLRLSLSWIVEFAYKWELLVPFALSLLISFYATFGNMGHYKKIFLVFLIVLIGVPSYLSFQADKDKKAAEHFFSDHFPGVYYAPPQFLDGEYFHFITRKEMVFNSYPFEKEFFNLETGEINPVLVPNVVNLQEAFFNSERNILYIGNKAYSLKDDEIYVLKCRDLFNDKKLQNLFKGKKVLCMAEYRKFPREGMQEGRKYQNIIARYAPQNLPSKSGFMLKFLLNVRPYMYNGEAEVLEKDVLFADTVFLYQPPNQFIGEYYNPKLKRKNFCPVSIAYYAGKCIEFRKLFVPIGSKDENT